MLLLVADDGFDAVIEAEPGDGMGFLERCAMGFSKARALAP